MFFLFRTRRGLVIATVSLLALAAIAVLARGALLGFALSGALRSAGASDVSFDIARVSPSRVVVTDLGFRYADGFFRAKQLVLARRQWWMASFGSAQVTDAHIPVDLDRLQARRATGEKSEPVGKIALPALPLEEITFDGVVALGAGELPERSLKISFVARQEARRWRGEAAVEGPGLGMKLSGHVEPATSDWAVELHEAKIQIQPWRDFVEHFAPLALDDWKIDGTIEGEGRASMSGPELRTNARVRIRDVTLSNAKMNASAEGVVGDIEFDDLQTLRSKPAELRVREVRVGKLTIAEVHAEITLHGTERIAVTRFSAAALGGAIAIEPFEWAPGSGELDATVLVDGLSVEQVLALTQDLPAKATGYVSGRLPVHLDDGGFRLGTGWLGLKPGSAAELQLHAAGLLTGGASPSSQSYALLQRVESGLLKLKVHELRLDIRPPGSPESRSATLRVSGAPVDPSIKAPVTLDLNVNGPLESLLNLGLKSGASFGTKP